MSNAQDIEDVNAKAREMLDDTGVHPEMAIVARELAREKREWRERCEAVTAERDELVKVNASHIQRLLAGGLI